MNGPLWMWLRAGFAVFVTIGQGALVIAQGAAPINALYLFVAGMISAWSIDEVIDAWKVRRIRRGLRRRE
jgi:hypothetical protein